MAKRKTKTIVKRRTMVRGKGKRKVNWLLVLLMSIFFGGFAVDRFIMGKIGTGILKLITFGGFGVWWLVDIILIASKYEFKDIEWAEK